MTSDLITISWLFRFIKAAKDEYHLTRRNQPEKKKNNNWKHNCKLISAGVHVLRCLRWDRLSASLRRQWLRHKAALMKCVPESLAWGGGAPTPLIRFPDQHQRHPPKTEPHPMIEPKIRSASSVLSFVDWVC